jgi:Ca-activated chloride channel homolog
MKHLFVRGRRLLTFLLAVVSWACLSGPQSALAADPASTIVVFDGSGSMWGKLEGEKQTKLVLAREALKASAAKLKPDSRLGLASFGHRRQADCTDVQVIVPPEGGTAEKIGTVLDKHNPRGKGPLTFALKESAKALGKGPGRKSIILIHDDPDNCQQDACAALGELQASAPGIQISVIGVGLKPDDTQRLMCLTKPTGGAIIDAQNGAQIAAGIDEAVRLASLEAAAPVVPAVELAKPAAVPVAAAPVQPVVPQRAPLITTGPPALRLAALLAPDALPHPHSVRWSVTPETAGASPVFTGAGQDVIVPLPAGRYIVEAQDGLVRATQPVEVKEAGQSSGDLVLNAGVLRLTLATGRDAASAAMTAVTIFEMGANGSAAGSLKPVGVLSGFDDTVALPAARYLVRVQRGAQIVERPMTIAAGRTEDLSMTLNSSRLMLSLAAAPGQPVTPKVADDERQAVLFTIFEDDPDMPKGRREVTRSAAPEPDFILAPGTYYVVARQGYVEARERITLVAGEVLRKSLSLLPATVKLSQRLGAMPPGGASAAVTYRLERLDVVPPDIMTINQAATTVLLPAGRYRIDAHHGRINAQSSREVIVAAGETYDVVFEPKAGLVQFKLGGEAAAAATDVFWELRDTDGRPVLVTAQSNLSALLQAGRYTVAAETRDKRYQKAFEVRTGEQHVVELTN